jgi:hypothetical protein
VKDLHEEFKDWYADIAKLSGGVVKQAWDHQQNKINKLKRRKDVSSPNTSESVEAFEKVATALENLNPEDQKRILRAVAVIYGIVLGN